MTCRWQSNCSGVREEGLGNFSGSSGCQRSSKSLEKTRWRSGKTFLSYLLLENAFDEVCFLIISMMEPKICYTKHSLNWSMLNWFWILTIWVVFLRIQIFDSYTMLLTVSICNNVWCHILKRTVVTNFEKLISFFDFFCRKKIIYTYQRRSSW